jgi:hypothetical protein
LDVGVVPAVRVVLQAGERVAIAAGPAEGGVDRGHIEAATERVVLDVIAQVGLGIDPVADRAQVVGQRPAELVRPCVPEIIDHLVGQKLIDRRAPQIPVRQVIDRYPVPPGPVELEHNLPVFIHKHLLLARRTAAIVKHPAADELVLRIVAVLDARLLGMGARLVRDLNEAIAMVPRVIGIRAVADPGALGDVAFVVVGVIVGAVGREAIIRARREAVRVPVPVGVRLVGEAVEVSGSQFDSSST